MSYDMYYCNVSKMFAIRFALPINIMKRVRFSFNQAFTMAIVMQCIFLLEIPGAIF